MAKRQAVQTSVDRYRARMRRAGFRLVQLWVPNTRAEGFSKECRRQSRAASRHAEEQSVSRWIDASVDVDGWTA